MLRAMPRLVRLPSRDLIAEITQEQLDQLVELLEEESEEDRDYYIDRDTLEHLRDNDADPELVAVLEGALGEGEDMDMAWEA